MDEVYRLRLDHYMVAGEERLRLDEPMVVQMMLDMRQGITAPYCLNRMLDMMRDEILRRAGEQE